MFFLAIAASVSLVALTIVTIVGVFKHPFEGSFVVWLLQRMSGLAFATAGAVLKPQLYGQPATFWPVALEWIVLVFAAYAWGHIIAYQTHVIEDWLGHRTYAVRSN